MNRQSFVLWGGFIVASVILDVIGFYFSTVVGTVLFGVCLAVAFLLAMGRNVESLDKLEEEHPALAKVFEVVGKADVIFSILLLPWIARAFAISMGWNWSGGSATGNIGTEYAEMVVYVMAFVWGVLIAFALGRWGMKKFLGR